MTLLEKLRFVSERKSVLDRDKQLLTDAADEIDRLTRQLAEARVVAERYDQIMRDIGTCGDGGCLVLRPTGQHTNGGCHCWRNAMKAQRVMRAAVLLRTSIAHTAAMQTTEKP